MERRAKRRFGRYVDCFSCELCCRTFVKDFASFPMPVWFRRFRMEFDLQKNSVPQLAPIPGFEFAPWHETLLDAHVSVKQQSFKDGSDTAVFPSLGDESGCYRLMQDITTRDGFIPESCWLAIFTEPGACLQIPCGTIQAIRMDDETGAIQNVGIIPEYRGQGLGSRLVYAALDGMRSVGVRWATLEVTARNTGAVQLYSRLGFRLRKVVFKPGNVAPAA